MVYPDDAITTDIGILNNQPGLFPAVILTPPGNETWTVLSAAIEFDDPTCVAGQAPFLSGIGAFYRQWLVDDNTQHLIVGKFSNSSPLTLGGGCNLGTNTSVQFTYVPYDIDVRSTDTASYGILVVLIGLAVIAALGMIKTVLFAKRM